MGNGPDGHDARSEGQNLPPSSCQGQFTTARFLRKLALGIVVFDLLIASLAGLSVLQVRRDAEDRALVTAQNFASMLEHGLSGWIDKIDLSLVSVKQEAERQLATGGMVRTNLNSFVSWEFFMRQPTLRDIGLAAADGNVTVGTGIGNAPLNISHRPYFIRLRDATDDRLVISEPFQRYSNGEQLIALARRINRSNGSFAGVVVGLMIVDQFEKYFGSLNLGPQGQVSLRSLDLSAVAQYPQSPNVGGAAGDEPVSQVWKEKVSTTPKEGTYTAVASDGLKRIFAYKKVGQYPFYISVGLLPETDLSEWYRHAGGIGAMSGLCFLFSGLFFWQMARFWTSREAELRK